MVQSRNTLVAFVLMSICLPCSLEGNIVSGSDRSRDVKMRKHTVSQEPRGGYNKTEREMLKLLFLQSPYKVMKENRNDIPRTFPRDKNKVEEVT